MKIIFSHGLGSSANSNKINLLDNIAQQKGLQTLRVNEPTITDPDERAARLIARVGQLSCPVILVGSSMGAYTSVVAAPHCCQLAGMFLIAPALYLPNYAVQNFPEHFSAPLEIVHGWADEVVPWQNALQFAQKSGAQLHLIAGDHRLHAAKAELVALFSHFLTKIQP